MKYCVNCGHELGVGRYCTNCGHPVDTDAPVRPQRPDVPPTQPPAGAPPPPARFPLFADEADAGPDPTATAPIARAPMESPTDHRRSGTPYGVWIAVAVVLVLIACLGGWLLLSGDDDSPDQASGPASTGPAHPEPKPSKTAETSAPAVPGDVTSEATSPYPTPPLPARTPRANR